MYRSHLHLYTGSTLPSMLILAPCLLQLPLSLVAIAVGFFQISYASHEESVWFPNTAAVIVLGIMGIVFCIVTMVLLMQSEYNAKTVSTAMIAVYGLIVAITVCTAIYCITFNGYSCKTRPIGDCNPALDEKAGPEAAAWSSVGMGVVVLAVSLVVGLFLIVNMWCMDRYTHSRQQRPILTSLHTGSRKMEVRPDPEGAYTVQQHDIIKDEKLDHQDAYPSSSLPPYPDQSNGKGVQFYDQTVSVYSSEDAGHASSMSSYQHPAPTNI